MSVHGPVLLAILAMAAVTVATRLAGLLVPERLGREGRWRAAFGAMPVAVLVAIVAPTVLATGWRESVAAAVIVVAALRLPLVVVVILGVAAAAALRGLWP